MKTLESFNTCLRTCTCILSCLVHASYCSVECYMSTTPLHTHTHTHTHTHSHIHTHTHTHTHTHAHTQSLLLDRLPLLLLRHLGHGPSPQRRPGLHPPLLRPATGALPILLLPSPQVGQPHSPHPPPSKCSPLSTYAHSSTLF